jgi:hypothetical protein
MFLKHEKFEFSNVVMFHIFKTRKNLDLKNFTKKNRQTLEHSIFQNTKYVIFLKHGKNNVLGISRILEIWNMAEKKTFHVKRRVMRSNLTCKILATPGH